MRYCVNGRQPYSILKKADEVKVAYRDRDRIMDFVEKIPDKTIILEIEEDAAEWATWEMYSDVFQEFHIALKDLRRWKEFADHGIKWYWPYPITSPYELSMIAALRPSYLFISAPLTFELEKVVSVVNDVTGHNVPMRMVVNNAKPNYLPALDTYQGICGQWVRPEDAAAYGKYIQCFEFENVDLKQEEVLLHVYAENQNWPGNLNLLIQNLNYNVDNRAFPEELAERRIRCGQKCFFGSGCHLCHAEFMFAEALRKEKARRKQESEN